MPANASLDPATGVFTFTPAPSQAGALDITFGASDGDLCSTQVLSVRTRYDHSQVLPEGNVASYTNKREEKSRERVLTDAELKRIWKSCLDDDYGAVLKLLMLTGQRANEIADQVMQRVREAVGLR